MTGCSGLEASRERTNMTKTIRREMGFRSRAEQVWRALTESATLAEWMFPNDFEPRVGHRFTFQVPGNPK